MREVFKFVDVCLVGYRLGDLINGYFYIEEIEFLVII